MSIRRSAAIVVTAIAFALLGGAAREALGAQFSGLWLNSGVQGWVVGLAPVR